jgi:hypothetical protein
MAGKQKDPHITLQLAIHKMSNILVQQVVYSKRHRQTSLISMIVLPLIELAIYYAKAAADDARIYCYAQLILKG